MAAIGITRRDLDATELRAEAKRTTDARQARRLVAIAMVLDGQSRELAAKAGGLDRQSLRDWVHRYNAEGVAGLKDRSRSGRPPRLSDEQQAEVADWVDEGPKLETDGVVRWRRIDLQRRIEQRFAVSLHERTVGKLLHKLKFSCISGRPLHPQSDLAAQEAFKKTSPSTHARRSHRTSLAGRSRSGSRMKPELGSKAR